MQCAEVATRCALEKRYFKSFGKFTGKFLCQSLVFNKAASLMELFVRIVIGGKPVTLLKQRL